MTEANPVNALRGKAKGFDFSKLRAEKNDKSANSGGVAYADIHRMDFVINGKNIDLDFIRQLYKKHNSLIENDKDGEKNYRLFAKEVFKEMFKYAETGVPCDHILEELVTNCNQAGYLAGVSIEYHTALINYGLIPQNPKKVLIIDYTDNNRIKVKSDMEIPVTKLDNPGEKICDLSTSLEFTLESQDGVTYKDGKLSLAAPKELKSYKENGKNLFSIIREYFQKFCEKLGFKFEINTQIEHNLDNSLKVNTHLESVEPPVCGNNYVLGHQKLSAVAKVKKKSL